MEEGNGIGVREGDRGKEEMGTNREKGREARIRRGGREETGDTIGRIRRKEEKKKMEFERLE